MTKWRVLYLDSNGDGRFDEAEADDMRTVAAMAAK